ncbi:uncharacterized protein BDZ99DRAFT_567632 [Mytilinidion resinicola]|uniref:C2H2-type domain-containing protein n=1 Tax=Mytilinidion resinicola TaxID=574789 RepID=A0A6A6YZE9_9PEZI|nr:uncharacterized protein BDZ99DRAFT_567632 [Mytilinidion resinicola]KAF2813918.1 hypothetical protein BDZ99DRAFT_567632 [Mytilinidion resinicola]
MTKRHWCRRCDRGFVDLAAISQHQQNSGRHNICNKCYYDAEDWEALLNHYRRRRCYEVCDACNIAIIPGQMRQHLKDEFACFTCKKHCGNEHNLEQHKIVHASADHECWACPRQFRSLPAMILHLEEGNCESGLSHLDLNESTAMSRQWPLIIVHEWRDILLARQDLSQYRGMAFVCPGCELTFRKLSAFFQHVASTSKYGCDEYLDSNATRKLTVFLKNRHYSTLT